MAEHFGKTHKSVLRAMRNLECSADFRGRNFAPIQIDVDFGMGRTRQDPAYRMTRDGFVFLAMGFTGKEAAQWKEAYIDTFNRMEAALTAPALTITPAQRQHLSELVDLVVESGRQKTHGETWARFHRKMKVPKYELLPVEKFDAACEYLHGKLDDQSIATLIQKHFPDAVKALPAPAQAELDLSTFSLVGVRLLISHDHTGREIIQRIPGDAMLATWDEIAHIMRDHFLMPSMKQLAAIVSAGVEAMAKRSGFGKPDPMPA